MSTFYTTSDERRKNALKIMHDTANGVYSSSEGSRLVRAALQKRCRCKPTFVACNHPEEECRCQNQDSR